jgi:hypothetical protein
MSWLVIVAARLPAAAPRRRPEATAVIGAATEGINSIDSLADG